MKSRCDEYLKGTVEWPDGKDYSDPENIGEGYQGDGYFDPLMNLGLCYQVGRAIDPTRARLYAARGVEVLLHMSARSGPHAVNPLRDSGYGIRYYGVGMAVGYDWLYDAMTPSQRRDVYQALNRWIDAFDRNGFGREHPQGNYFAGYYAAKGLTALTTAGDNPAAPRQWNDWLERLHRQMVQPYYDVHLVGGGWPEGWSYGPLGTLNMSWPVLAAKTARGMDLIHAAQPFSFPLDQALYLVHFAWPTRLTMDDRGALDTGDNPSATSPTFFTAEAGLLAFWNDASAPVFHRFAREVRTAHGTLVPRWQEFLDWDDAAPETMVQSLPLSYLARGMNMVAVRSSWETDAVWASFTSAPYLNNPESGEEFYDQGSLAIVRGGTPFLVNATGALVRNTPGTDDARVYGDLVYEDNYGNHDADPLLGNRTLYNIFYVKTSHGGQRAYGPSKARTHVSRFEDGGSYVVYRGSNLEDMYPLDPETQVRPITAWTRDVVYVRPKLFVVYDRTTVADGNADQWQAFHLAATPVPGAAPSPGVRRFDVKSGEVFVGSVTSLLPVQPSTTLVNVFNSSKVYRLEVRPGSAAADQRWLTVFDAASSADRVALAARLSAADGNVQTGNVLGVLLMGGSSNEVVLAGAGAADQRINGEVRYVVPAKPTRHIVTDLPANASWSVTVFVGEGDHRVTLLPGVGLKSTPAGVLCWRTDAAGVVTPG